MRKTKNLGSAPHKGWQHRLPPSEAGLNKLFQHYKYHADERNIKLSLTREEFRILTKQNCYYCNKPPLMVITTTCSNATPEGKEHAKYTYNGVDRVNNNLEYRVDNCVACCKICNRFKTNLEVKEFIKHVNLIYNHIGKTYEEK